MSRPHAALRRYPALGFLLVAGLLATLLPSSLRIPLSGPSTAAEVAPVPGEGDSSGDLSELGQASSGGLGFGRGGGGVGGATSTTAAPDGDGGLRARNPKSKRCVGDPPRQTEDPLSPPCVAYFEGDNGGATTRGVSRDEIVLVIHLGVRTSVVWEDLSAPAAPADGQQTAAAKALVRYLNDRYQLYGRRVRAWGYGSRSQSDAEWKADVAAIDNEKRPFAIIAMLDGIPTISREAAARGIFASSYAAFAREAYQSAAPYLISFVPDIDDQAAIVGSYICTKLAGRTARWAGDPTLASRTRKFGVVFTDEDSEPEYRTMRSRLRDELSRRCSVAPAVEAPWTAGNANAQASAIAQMRTAEVTTVITVMNGGGAGGAANNAGSQGYLPEWIVPGGGAGGRGPDRNAAAQLANQSAWRSAFGLSFDYRRDAPVLQPWYQAYAEACPSCAEIRRNDVPELYDALALLAYGIQSAGPRLTPTSFDRGMHAIPQRGSANPYKPAAYFSPGNYSFVKDAVEIWWDGDSPGPGSSRPGCYRLVDDGRRTRAGEWTGDDSSVFSGNPPCQGNSVPQ